ncbi:MAG: DUF4129 domain-containing protein, partial [Planctomycetes bacterium]|nr:DUF4129 domain-containing protein [Planctomycetota bacterium]
GVVLEPLLLALARLGHRREPGETLRGLARRADTPSGAVSRAIEAYYRARFGHAPGAEASAAVAREVGLAVEALRAPRELRQT